MAKLYPVNSKRILSTVVTFWFTIAVLGQWIFASYVLWFYGRATVTGHTENWNKVLPHGYVPGDFTGNIVVGLQLVLTIFILIAGPIQIIPGVRKAFPLFHRWTGRIYILIAFAMSISGLFMVWVRGSVGGVTQHISISVNAVLIMVSAMFTVKYARAGDMMRHRIWAIRLFLFVNGVWFFRVGLYFWLFINQEPVGFDSKTFEGPFLYFLTFSQYIIPLALFELYLRAKKSSSNRLLLISTTALFLFTIIMAIGIFAASIAIWFPKMNE